jgi:hypothetical protein
LFGFETEPFRPTHERFHRKAQRNQQLNFERFGTGG